jgi:uncharacterized membrane protein
MATAQAHPERLARALGWLSIGLGLAEVAAPRRIARLIGAPEHPTLLRAFGLRELASGIGILSQRRPRGAMWSRVAGDALDLSALGAAFGSRRADTRRLAAATAAVAGVTALDAYTAARIARTNGRAATAGTEEIRCSLTINRRPEELHSFWRDFENLPLFMRHLESVRVVDDRRSHWVATAPAGGTVEWDAEITEDVPGERIAWRSLPGSDVEHEGVISFVPAPAGCGTYVQVTMRVAPPGGKIGTLFARIFGEAPDQQVSEDLRRFKRLIETGEIPTTEGQSSGRRRARVRPRRSIMPFDAEKGVSS